MGKDGTLNLGEISEIPKGMFYNYIFVENLKIPNTITRIGDSAFKHCLSLKNVEFSDDLNDIGAYAFSYCYELKILQFRSMLDILEILPLESVVV